MAAYLTEMLIMGWDPNSQIARIPCCRDSSLWGLKQMLLETQKGMLAFVLVSVNHGEKSR